MTTKIRLEMTIFWDAAPYMLMITLMMEAVSTSDVSVKFYQTTHHNIPEDSYLHTYCHKNLKSHPKISLVRQKMRTMTSFGK
jgi:hypothetical protein